MTRGGLVPTLHPRSHPLRVTALSMAAGHSSCASTRRPQHLQPKWTSHTPPGPVTPCRRQAVCKCPPYSAASGRTAPVGASGSDTCPGLQEAHGPWHQASPGFPSLPPRLEATLLPVVRGLCPECHVDVMSRGHRPHTKTRPSGPDPGASAPAPTCGTAGGPRCLSVSTAHGEGTCSWPGEGMLQAPGPAPEAGVRQWTWVTGNRWEPAGLVTMGSRP